MKPDSFENIREFSESSRLNLNSASFTRYFHTMDEECWCLQLSFVFEVGVLDVVHEPEMNEIII